MPVSTPASTTVPTKLQTRASASTPQSSEEEAETSQLVSTLNNTVFSIWDRFTRPPAFKPHDARPVILSTWMKSGTTLLQQLVYQLFVTTGRVPTDPTGTDFDEISLVVPAIHLSGVGSVSRSLHDYEPSAWKTHSDASAFEGPNYTDARFIVIVREGRATMRSFANYIPKFFAKQTIEGPLRARYYEKTFRSFFLRTSVPGIPDITYDADLFPWFDYVRSWRDSHLADRTLFLIYEDMVSDMERAVRMVARFLQVDVTDDVINKVCHRCSKEYMLGKSQFNSRAGARIFDLGLNDGVRVRADDSDGFEHVASDEAEAEYDRQFMEKLGVAKYEELCEQLREMSSKLLR